MKSLSLTARLTLLFAACAATVLLGFGWGMTRAVDHHFLELDQQEIEGKLALVRNLLTNAHSAEDLASLAPTLDEALVGHPGLSVAMKAPDGAIPFSSRGEDVPAALLGSTELAGGRLVSWAEGERWFRGLTAGAPTGTAPSQPYTVTIALDITPHRQFMTEFHRTLGAVIILAVLVTAALGLAATRAGLRPLRRLTAHVAGLDASGLGARLSQEGVPAEIETLVVAFNAMLARLEDSFQRLSEFSSDIAHELRTPVSNLMVQTQVALSGTRDIEQYRETLYANLEEYERMAQMIGDMLFLAQADNDLLKPSTTAVDLAAEVGALFDYFNAWADERGVTLTLDGSAAVAGDRLMLRRALSNLLANAIRHTAPGEERVRVHLEADRQGAQIAVENPGPPIPPELLPRLFDRFYRVDPSRRRQDEGAGLGLAIVKSIVAAHGGTISVSSGPRGTRFLITLPSADLAR
ncbi:MAG: heavy metal sensor histidine kinase [Chromatiaceae bacterium]